MMLILSFVIHDPKPTPTLDLDFHNSLHSPSSHDCNHVTLSVANLMVHSSLNGEGACHERFEEAYNRGALLAATLDAQAQQTNDLERIQAASRQFAAAIAPRDINAMDTVWAHESYASFIGPLSTSVVVGWDGVRCVLNRSAGRLSTFSEDVRA